MLSQRHAADSLALLHAELGAPPLTILESGAGPRTLRAAVAEAAAHPEGGLLTMLAADVRAASMARTWLATGHGAQVELQALPVADGVLVLSPANVEALVRTSVAQLAAHPVDEAEAERQRLAALVAELDGKIRRTVHHVVKGLLDEADAKVLNAPLLAQREQARLRLATLPSVAPPPAADTIDPDAFRTAVLQAWHDRPL